MTSHNVNFYNVQHAENQNLHIDLNIANSYTLNSVAAVLRASAKISIRTMHYDP